jgi:2-phosphoglycerate kinase
MKKYETADQVANNPESTLEMIQEAIKDERIIEIHRTHSISMIGLDGMREIQAALVEREKVEKLIEELVEDIEEMNETKETKPYDEGYRDGSVESKEVVINKLKRIIERKKDGSSIIGNGSMMDPFRIKKSDK